MSYQSKMMDLALKDGLAVVLLERDLSVVDVTDSRAPVEIGRVETDGRRLERLALSGSRACVWGEFRDIVGVVTFDLSQPDRPRLEAKRLLYPVEKGATPWLRRIPRLAGWAVWKNHLYAGFIREAFLEMHRFDIREGGRPQPVHVMRIEEAEKHAWNNEWAMRFSGSRAFMTLGHDFLGDPRKPVEVDYLPWTRLPRLMMIDGESAYALQGNAVQTYARTSYGAYVREETLGLSDRFRYRLSRSIFESTSQDTPTGRDKFIVAGDHIYALLNNHLAIFENPRKAK